MTTWLFEPAVDGRAAGGVLEITLRFEGEITVCLLDGPLCAYTAPILDRWLGQLSANGRDRVIVDAAQVDSMSTDGVEVLAAHAARLRGTGGALQIRSPSVAARRVFARCGADHLVQDEPGG